MKRTRIIITCLSIGLLIGLTGLVWWFSQTEEPEMELESSRVFFNNSDWDEQYLFMVEETAGSCADFLAHRLTAAQGERFSIIVGELQVGSYPFAQEQESPLTAWCFATTGTGREAPLAQCTAGEFTLTEVTPQKQVTGSYQFLLDNGETKQLAFTARYCPFE